MITLGPFLTRSEHPGLHVESLAHTGYSMELVAGGLHHVLPIFRDVSHMAGQYASFDDFYFPEPRDGWPVEFTFRGFHEKQTSHGRFVSVSPLLTEIFRASELAAGLEDFLREFRTWIPVSASREPGWHHKPKCVVRLTDKLAAEGYTVASIMSYGVRLTVDIAWCFRDDYQGWQKIDSGQMEFRPRCGMLNDGKWNRLRWRECIDDHFWNRFEAIAADKPINCFRADQDIQNLLSHFEWTATTRHNAREIRDMRVNLVRSARHVWESPKDLAALLQKEGLYSRRTSIHQIVKFLPSLMEEANLDTPAHGKSAPKSSTREEHLRQRGVGQ